MSAEPGPAREPGPGASGSGSGGPPPWTGPWADDVRRIFEIVQEHVSRPDAGPDAPEHPPECAYCPICQGINLVRRSGPETLDRIADLAAGLAATLRATDPRPDPKAETRAATNPGPGPDHPGPATPRATPPASIPIDVTD